MMLLNPLGRCFQGTLSGTQSLMTLSEFEALDTCYSASATPAPTTPAPTTPGSLPPRLPQRLPLPPRLPQRLLLRFRMVCRSFKDLWILTVLGILILTRRLSDYWPSNYSRGYQSMSLRFLRALATSKHSALLSNLWMQIILLKELWGPWSNSLNQ